ncbi:MAG: response regulator [Dissulfurispiraceae bacterium]
MAKEKIVVIDDSPIVRKLAELALEEEGYKVYTAEDGEEGLRISEEVRPSVILVDFIMPRISGYQFCKSARENELLKDIPIILITGKGEDVGKKFEEKFGVVDYFIKPFKSEMLVEKVNSIVNAQRQLLGEYTEVVEAGEAVAEPLGEMPAFSLEETGGGEGTALEAAEMMEFPETSTLSFDAEEAPSEAEPGGTETAEEVPEFSFEVIDNPKEPEISHQEPAYELDLGAPSFDFNLAKLTAQDIDLLEEQKISTPAIPVMPEAYDFEAIQQLQGADAAEEIVEPVPGPAAVMDHASVTGIASVVDGIMRRYFIDELPMLIEKGMEDILKQYGIIKPSTILITGSLENICMRAVLKLVSDQELTGKLFVISTSGSAEIYFANGLVVYALTSKRGKALASSRLAPGSGLSAETLIDLHEGILEAVSMISDLKEGNFFFEKMALPAALGDIYQRKDVTVLLLESMRKGEGKAGNEGLGNQDSVYVQAMSDSAAKGCELTDEEQLIFTLADGQRSATSIAALSGVELTQTLMILDRLTKARILRNQGGF